MSLWATIQDFVKVLGNINEDSANEPILEQVFMDELCNIQKLILNGYIFPKPKLIWDQYVSLNAKILQEFKQDKLERFGKERKKTDEAIACRVVIRTPWFVE